MIKAIATKKLTADFSQAAEQDVQKAFADGFRYAVACRGENPGATLCDWLRNQEDVYFSDCRVTKQNSMTLICFKKPEHALSFLDTMHKARKDIGIIEISESHASSKQTAPALRLSPVKAF